MQNREGAKNNQRKEAMEGRTLKVRVGLHLSSNVMSQSDCDSQAVRLRLKSRCRVSGIKPHWREKMNT